MGKNKLPLLCCCLKISFFSCYFPSVEFLIRLSALYVPLWFSLSSPFAGGHEHGATQKVKRFDIYIRVFYCPQGHFSHGYQGLALYAQTHIIGARDHSIKPLLHALL